MFENLSSVRIISKYFQEGIDCEFFKGFGRRCNQLVDTRMALVYGKNGTGKSTLSSAFNYINIPDKLRNDPKANPKGITDLSFNHIDIDDLKSDYQNIFVFNEEYVNEKITLQEDGIGTLVNFRDLGKKQYEIDDLNKEIKDYEKQLNNLKSKQNKDKMTNLKWNMVTMMGIEYRPRYEAIYDKKYNRSFEFDDIDPAILNYQPQLYFDYELSKDEFDQLALYVKQFRNMEPIHIPLNDIPFDYLENLLMTKVKHPTLNEHELFLVSIADSIDDLYINSSLTKEKINHIRDSEEYKYISALKKIKLLDLNHVFLDECFRPYIDEQIRVYFETDIFNYNDIIHQLNESINMSLQDPYEMIDQDVYSLIKEFKTVCDQLEETLSKIDFETIYPVAVERLKELNIELSYYENKESIIQYHQLEQETKTINDRINKIKFKIKSRKQQIDKIEDTYKNKQIPIEEMNKALAYIFASSTRFKLKLTNNKIYLYSNESNVAPNSLSTAERNILAITYFFTSIYNQEGVNHADQKEYLVVLDDPVSSTDHDNTIGLYSYLQEEITKLMRNNPNSKCITLTHDQNVFLRMDKVYSKVKAVTDDSNRISYFELLPSKILDRINPVKLNDYSSMMDAVFKYGFENHPELEFFIGNTMRKLLEAFTTFEYNLKVSDLDNISGQYVFDLIRNETLKHYFMHLMNRPILNDESHMDNAAKYNYDNLLLNYISPSDLQRSAKDVLAFIYTLNPYHVKGHLNAGQVLKVKQWCEEIKNR